MPGEQFFDTNILIYAFTTGDRRGAKAESLLAEGGVIGVQVLNEFTSVVRRKLAWGWPQVQSALEVIAELTGPPLSLTADIHAQAVKLARDNSLAFYDALIVAAAADAGCRMRSEERRVGNEWRSRGSTAHYK